MILRWIVAPDHSAHQDAFARMGNHMSMMREVTVVSLLSPHAQSSRKREPRPQRVPLLAVWKGPCARTSLAWLALRDPHPLPCETHLQGRDAPLRYTHLPRTMSERSRPPRVEQSHAPHRANRPSALLPTCPFRVIDILSPIIRGTHALIGEHLGLGTPSTV